MTWPESESPWTKTLILPNAERMTNGQSEGTLQDWSPSLHFSGGPSIQGMQRYDR